MRKHVFLALGLFHIYLYTSKELVRYCGRYLLAPLYHRLHPNGQFHLNMKLKESAALFTQLRLAYPAVEGRMEIALNDLEIAPWQRTMLENIQFLCIYYIPMVTHLVLVVGLCLFVFLTVFFTRFSFTVSSFHRFKTSGSSSGKMMARKSFPFSSASSTSS